MKKLLDRLLAKRRYLVIDEAHLKDVLVIIDRHTPSRHKTMSIGNCGWANEITKWFIHMNATETTWARIAEDIKRCKFDTVPLLQQKGYYPEFLIF